MLSSSAWNPHALFSWQSRGQSPLCGVAESMGNGSQLAVLTWMATMWMTSVAIVKVTSSCPPDTSKWHPPPMTSQVRFFCPSVKLPRGLASQFVLLARALPCSLARECCSLLFSSSCLTVLFGLTILNVSTAKSAGYSSRFKIYMRYAPAAPVIRAPPRDGRRSS